MNRKEIELVIDGKHPEGYFYEYEYNLEDLKKYKSFKEKIIEFFIDIFIYIPIVIIMFFLIYIKEIIDRLK